MESIELSLRHQSAPVIFEASHKDTPSIAMKRLSADRVFSTSEAQQRYFSYRARLVAIVSQNSFNVLGIFGHPQTCVYPDVCLGIAHVSGKAPLPGQGVW